MDIRPAKEAQLLDVLYVIRECALQLQRMGVRYWHSSHADYADIAQDIAQQRVFVILHTGMVVGTVTLSVRPDNPREITLDRLAVFPHFQRRGFARALLGFADAHARSIGAEQIRVVTPAAHASFASLFEGTGYMRMGEANGCPGHPTGQIFGKRLGG